MPRLALLLGCLSRKEQAAGAWVKPWEVGIREMKHKARKEEK